MGRKPLNESAKASLLQIRLSPAERDELDAAAAIDGKPTSTWLRDIGLTLAREMTSAKKTRPSN